MEVPTEKILQYISLAIAVAGLLIQFFLPAQSSRTRRIAVAVIILITVIGFGYWECWKTARDLERVSEEIWLDLGEDRKTVEQIFSTLNYGDLRIAQEALDRLISTRKIRRKPMEIKDDHGAMYWTTVYFRRPPGP
jgi:hypothetical protein